MAKGDKFVVKWLSNVIISVKCLFRFFMRFFSKKNQKVFIIGKMRKYDEEGVFFSEKKRFHFFKSLF